MLSEFTGAARELTEALIVNPYDLEASSDALAAALTMPVEEQQDRMRSMRSLLVQFNVYRWAGKMLVDAARLRNQERVAGRLAERASRGSGGLTMQYLLSRASRPILTRLAQERTLCAFDFDGTLAPIVEHPDQAGMREPDPASARPPGGAVSVRHCLRARPRGPSRQTGRRQGRRA